MFILSYRNKERDQAAAECLVKGGVKAAIEVLQLDVSKDEQIFEAVNFVEIKYKKLGGTLRSAREKL